MERIIIKNIVLFENKIEQLHVYLDDKGDIIILPMLWLIHLSTTQSVFKNRLLVDHLDSYNPQYAPKLVNEIFPNEIADNTVQNYIGHMYHFLEYINLLNKQKNTPCVHNTHCSGQVQPDTFFRDFS